MTGCPGRREHARDRWHLEHDERDRWCFSKNLGDAVAKVHGTTPTTCAWGVYRLDGLMFREASSRDAENAKALADEWVRDNFR